MFTGGRVEMSHRVRARDKGSLMKLYIHFMFLSPRGTPEGTMLVLLVRVENIRRQCRAHSLPRPQETLARRVALSGIGCQRGDIMIRSDEEPAIFSLTEDVDRRRAIIDEGRSHFTLLLFLVDFD